MKKLTEWVEKSFVNKTIFVLSIIGVLLIVFVLIPSAFRLVHKMNLIESGVVYVARDGTRYHLFDDCSNMNNPIETTESVAKDRELERCSKCYSGVKNYYEPFASVFYGWDEISWIEFLSATVTIACAIIVVVFSRKEKKTTPDKHEIALSLGYAFGAISLAIFIITILTWEI